MTAAHPEPGQITPPIIDSRHRWPSTVHTMARYQTRWAQEFSAWTDQLRRCIEAGDVQGRATAEFVIAVISEVIAGLYGEQRQAA